MPTKIKIKTPTEHAEQVALFEWVAWRRREYPELGLLYATPNGGKRNAVTGANLKAEGVKAGVPDMCLPVARSGYHGLYIELKRVKGGNVSDAQADWLIRLNAQGYKAVVCKGWREASEVIEKYLKNGGA